MTDTFAASLAFLGAGVVLLTHFLPWPPAIGTGIVIIAVSSLIGLGLRRHGYIDRLWGAGVAGLSGASIIVLSVIAVSGPVAHLVGPGLAAIAGLLMIGCGYADFREVSRNRLLAQLQSTSTGIAIGLFGLVGIFGWSVGLTGIVSILISGQLSEVARTIISVFALVLGTFTVAVAVLVANHHSMDFLDYSLPSRTEWGVVLVGVAALFALSLIVGITTRLTGVESAPHTVIRTATTDPTVLLILIPLSVFLIGPSEEFLYRNIIQKLLYRSFSRYAAILIASVIFAGTHVFAFRSAPTPVLPTLSALGAIFAMSLVLGVLYDRTDNIVVSALTHGLFNAAVLAVTYVRLTMG